MASAGLPIYLDEFNCSLCLDLTTDPVTTPCGHNICKGCINLFWEDYRGVYSCPQCNQTFIPRPFLCKNSFIADMVENLKMTESFLF
uniref:RING-type domain-containing protein n=1 Tax=Astyanax mexicanus TaxID=7994 RepID=A0A8B9GKQ6_ASTMX